MSTYRFGRFEMDARTGELRCDGHRIALSPKVADILSVLVQSNGRLVSRKELQELIWPDTNTDRERGLNNLMNRLRDALDDSATEPRFIETVPKRGYRFLVRVELVRLHTFHGVAVAIGAIAVLAIAVFYANLSRLNQPQAPVEYWAALRRIKLGGVTDLSEARSLLDAATRKSPDFAPAFAALAPLLLDLADSGKVEAAEARRQAGEAARNAVRLNNDSSDAHLAAGIVHLRAEWQLWLAGEEIDRAIRLNPASAEAWRARATLLLARADAGGAVRAAERAVALDPLSAWVQTASGRAIYYHGDVKRSSEQLEQTLRIAPEFGPAHRYLSEVYWQAGRREDARLEFLNTVRLSGMGTAEVRRIDEITSQDGLSGFWRSELASLRAQESRYGVPYKLGSLHAALDQLDESVSWLERSVEQRDTQLLFLRVNPWFDKLRSSPRFRLLLQRIPSS